MSGSARRLFVAVDLPPPLARRLADAAPTAPGVKRVRPEAMHLTLHFLGDVAEATIPAVAAALDQVRLAPFALDLAGPGRFPPRGPARVLWMGVAANAALDSLHAACGRAIAAAGLPLESRPFTPHITLARLTDAADRHASDAFLASAPIPAAFPVERIILYASERTPTGAVHVPLHEVPLTGCPTPRLPRSQVAAGFQPAESARPPQRCPAPKWPRVSNPRNPPTHCNAAPLPSGRGFFNPRNPPARHHKRH